MDGTWHSPGPMTGWIIHKGSHALTIGLFWLGSIVLPEGGKRNANNLGTVANMTTTYYDTIGSLFVPWFETPQMDVVKLRWPFPVATPCECKET